MVSTFKRPLYLITDSYPWGSGEKSFVGPELKYLNRFFDVTLISCANKEELEKNELLSQVPVGVSVANYNSPNKIIALFYVAKYFFSRAGLRELNDLIKDGFSFGRLKDSLASYIDASWLRYFCKKNGFFDSENSIFYSFWFNSHLLALALEKMSRKGALKIISRIHGYDLYNNRNANSRQPFQRYKRDLCNRIFFASENAMNEFIAEFGDERFPGQYVLSRLGVQERKPSAKTHKKEEHKLLVSCSNVIPLKRVDFIARALVLLGRNDIQWVHFGDGPLLGDVKQYAQENSLNACFTGSVNNDMIIDFYRNNDVDAVILVSETEGGCPVCLQEALSFGIPIIGTNVGGIPETIDGNGILLADNPSVEDIAEAIKAIVNADSNEKEIMALRSNSLWSERYNLDVNKKAFVEDILDL